MSLIAVYRAFRQDLMGWTKVTFDEFRNFYEPLRRRRVWPDADKKKVESLASNGGAFALRRLYAERGEPLPQIAEILGERGKEPECMSRDELDGHMKSLIESCLKEGWSPQTFLSFGTYLDSDKTPDDISDTKAAATAGSMYHSGTSAVPNTAMKGKKPEPIRDLFAEKYRAAIPAFKDVVQTYLKEGAIKAASRKKSANSGTEGQPTPDINDPTPALLTAFGESTIAKDP